MAILKISVLMSVYNEPIKWIEESILSILNQSYPVYEFIIIIDNPERHDLIDYVKSFESNIIKLIVNDINLGLIRSLNRAIDAASGDFFARMDADDISNNTRFEDQLTFLLDNKFDLIGSFATAIDEENNYLYDIVKPTSSKNISKCVEIGFVPMVHPTFFGKKEVFQKIRYSEDAIYAEDYEFMARALTNSYKVSNISKNLLKYRVNSASVTKTNAYSAYITGISVKESFQLYLKNNSYIFIRKIEKDNEIERVRYNNRQKVTNLAKASLRNKNYIGFAFNLIKSIYYDPSVIRLMAINLYVMMMLKLEKSISHY